MLLVVEDEDVGGEYCYYCWVEFAQASGQVLVGFLRPSKNPANGMRMNVYAGTLTD